MFRYWGTEEGDALHAGECMQELLEQVRRHKVNIDGDVCTVMVTTLVLEVSFLAPSFLEVEIPYSIAYLFHP